MEEIYAGIYLACEKYGVDLVGGDTCFAHRSDYQHHLHRRGEEGKIVYRNGAKVVDLICVTGDLGSAYMGLQLLEREKRFFQVIRKMFNRILKEKIYPPTPAENRKPGKTSLQHCAKKELFLQL